MGHMIGAARDWPRWIVAGTALAGGFFGCRAGDLGASRDGAEAGAAPDLDATRGRPDDGGPDGGDGDADADADLGSSYRVVALGDLHYDAIAQHDMDWVQREYP